MIGKISKMIVIMAITLVMISSAFATTVGPIGGNVVHLTFEDELGNPAQPEVVLYECAEADCYTLLNQIDKIDAGTDSTVDVYYPITNFPDVRHYAYYAFNQDYPLYKGGVNDNHGSSWSWGPYDLTYNKLENGRAPLSGFSLNYYNTVLNQVEVGMPITVDVEARLSGDVVSALTDPGVAPHAVPPGYESHYSADVTLRFVIYNPSGNVVYDQTMVENLYMDTSKTITFPDWIPTIVGTGYSYILTSDVTDAKFDLSTGIQESITEWFSVVDPNAEVCYTNMESPVYTDTNGNPNNFPVVGDTITVSTNRLSIYRDLSLNLNPVPTYYEINVIHDNSGTVDYQGPHTTQAASSTESFQWTPSHGGWYTLYFQRIKAVDSRCNGIQNDGELTYHKFVATQPIVNTAPRITSTPETTATENTLYIYNVEAEDDENDQLTYSLKEKPAGMIINTNTGLITWLAGTPGAYDIEVEVRDGSLTDTQLFTITVTQATPTNNAPTLNGLPDKTLTENTVLDNEIDLWDYADDNEDTDSNLLFSVMSATSYECGVTVDSNHYIDIAPTSGFTGTCEVTIVVEDTGGLIGTDTFTVTVNPATNNTPNINFPDIQIEIGETLDYNLDDYVTPDSLESTYIWDIFPTISLNFTFVDIIIDSINRILTVIGLSEGTEDVTLTVTNPSSGDSDSNTINIIVTNPILPPTPNLDVEIVADQTSGEAPLEVEFEARILSGTYPFQYDWDFDGDGITDSIEKEPEYTFNKGVHIVTLTVTDANNYVDTEIEIITVSKENTNTQPRNQVQFNTLRVMNEDVRAGDDLELLINFGNNGEDMNALATIYVQELSLRDRVGPFNSDSGDSVSRIMSLNIPEDTEPGMYDLKITVSDRNGMKRVRYREFRVI